MFGSTARAFALSACLTFFVLGGALACPTAAFAESKGGAAQAVQYNPQFHYFVKGQIIGPREFSLGDTGNWYTPIKNLSGRSATGKVKVMPDTHQTPGDAMKITWSKTKATGQVALFGQPIDLTLVKDKAALVFDVKVERKPKGSVTIAMDCEWPCRGALQVHDILRQAPVGQWLSFPIPLSCFKGDKFDLSKINGVFLISTEGALTLSVANIRVERLPADMQGCAE